MLHKTKRSKKATTEIFSLDKFSMDRFIFRIKTIRFSFLFFGFLFLISTNVNFWWHFNISFNELWNIFLFSLGISFQIIYLNLRNCFKLLSDWMYLHLIKASDLLVLPVLCCTFSILLLVVQLNYDVAAVDDVLNFQWLLNLWLILMKMLALFQSMCDQGNKSTSFVSHEERKKQKYWWTFYIKR